MLFNSLEYILLFLPLVLIGYFTLSKVTNYYYAKVWLLLASIFFYGYWDERYILLIITAIIFNFFIGNKIVELKISSTSNQAKYLFIVGIIANIGMLFYYKYTNFFIDNINVVVGSNIILEKIVLPIGISFFTFQMIGFLVDCFQGKTHEKRFIDFALFVSFFPQLIAGPIIHHSQTIPQFEDIKNRSVNWDNIAKGIYIFAIGLFKKVVIADTFAVWANNGFDVATNMAFIEAWVAALSYTFQLYFDFSGYSDMAVGAALMFNITIATNFNSPYKATDIQDFWRRWHITLSNFLRDYLYIPLGGNRNGEVRTHINLFLVFLIGGFWHGANWTFVIWGALHGVANSVYRFWSQKNISMPKYISVFITFMFVNIAWVFFRATSVDNAYKVLAGMFGLNGIALPKVMAKIDLFQQVHFIRFGEILAQVTGHSGLSVENIFPLVAIIIASFIVFSAPNSNLMVKKFKPTLTTLLYSALLFIFAIYMLDNTPEFLYFDF